MDVAVLSHAPLQPFRSITPVDKIFAVFFPENFYRISSVVSLYKEFSIFSSGFVENSAEAWEVLDLIAGKAKRERGGNCWALTPPRIH